jgi:glycosyltransferase involved in cell wall biosynthesis
MATELPFVASPVGVNAELLAKDQVGIGADTPDEWELALERIYASPEASRAMGVRGRTLALREFSIDLCAAKLAEVFCDIGNHGC